MNVEVIPCGPFANESEKRAVNALKTRLISSDGVGTWLLLTNLAFSSSPNRQSDEIDIVAIGPPGVRVIEVKHWTAAWVKNNTELVEHEADRVTEKAKKVGTTLRRMVPSVGRVDGAFYLTREAAKTKPIAGSKTRGVPFFALGDWRLALGFDAASSLHPAHVRALAKTLSPKASVALDGALKRLANYRRLTLISSADERFHRIYKATHPTRQARVIVHLYDTSASDHANPELRARREFEALRRLQLHAWAPRIEDSFQEAPGYAGEMWFFSVADPGAPTTAERSADDAWTTDARVEFARNAMRALAELHQSGDNAKPMLHRNLTPDTILVKHDNTPILTGFHDARIPTEQTVADSNAAGDDVDATTPPEIRVQGLGAADTRSDTFALAASLDVLFTGRQDASSVEARDVLATATTDDPAKRATLEELTELLAEPSTEPPRPEDPVAARYWTEEQVVHFRSKRYRIVSRLGSGGVGTTFRVVELDRQTGDDLGAYVAKVVHDETIGKRVLRAYSRGRSFSDVPGLSTIFEYADEWRDNSFVALMTWIEGMPLSDLAGVLAIHAEDTGEESTEALCLRWLRTLCDALGALHGNGLVHGDVSPRNLIVSGADIVLTDYDCVTKVDELRSTGTVIYSSSTHVPDQLATPADDFYALAASFYFALYEREPFRYEGALAKERGLNWIDADRGEYSALADFLDKATHPDPGQRIKSADEAKAMLRRPADDSNGGTSDPEMIHVPKAPPVAPRTENEVPWLRSLLQSYPGSRWGNSETRGLDTDFAQDTYVETPLDGALLKQILERRVRLVILCGNAGDGKTALLQHLAQELGLGHATSETRVLQRTLEDGLTVRINLDGSASWRSKSADELLDNFLAPFQSGAPSEDTVHLLAVNDGRLLEWIERVEERQGQETPLTRALTHCLDADRAEPPEHIRFINLNQRSLVGGVANGKEIQTNFLEQLVDSLYGGKRFAETWAPCSTCSAQGRCETRRATKWFGPDAIDGGGVSDAQRQRARQRLFEALQAVHLRGETHITVRELRASLIYILFGTRYCSDYHANERSEPYWDRAFAPDSEARQGEVLRELIRFDPALEAHPKVDRHLSRMWPASRSLGQARRRAYFELLPAELERIAGDPEALRLARGEHLGDFRKLPIAADSHADLCRHLCRGISRLEDLPPKALDREGMVPLRITPRTPTETAFWIEKKLDDFQLEANLPPAGEGQDHLHREATLVYRYRNGRKERLRLGADLFHVLLELGSGYQLGDVSTDDTFAQLAIFVQRLVREDERRLLAWNPMRDEAIYEVSARVVEAEADDPLQQIHLQRLED